MLDDWAERPLSGDEIRDLNREYVFFSWSIQKMVDPQTVTGGEGIYYWDAGGR